MRKKRYLATGICATLILVAVFIFMGCPGSEQGGTFSNVAKKFPKEPEITVYLHKTKTKKTMPIEEYLLGVVAGEMRPDWPVEAYAAQAIVARTFTMDFIASGGTKKEHGTDISTDEVEAQAYNEEAITPEIRRAVEMTRGKVMTYRGKYVKGWFSASCGGRTALAKEGLAYRDPEPPYTRSVSCPEEKVIPKEELFWSARFTGDELKKALGELGKNIGTVTRIEVAARSKNSHRATALKLVGTNGQTKVAGADLRIAVDPQKMRSLWITDLNHLPGAIEMKGRGFGHGVGLCQWGAHALAKEGKSPEEIIRHYYPSVTIMDLW